MKGLTHSHTGEYYDYYMTSLQAIGADIMGMAETDTTWQHRHLQDHFALRARKHCGQTKISFGYPDVTTDPVSEKETFQSGGSLITTTGSFASMLHGGNITDQQDLEDGADILEGKMKCILINHYHIQSLFWINWILIHRKRIKSRIRIP